MSRVPGQRGFCTRVVCVRIGRRSGPFPRPRRRPDCRRRSRVPRRLRTGRPRPSPGGLPGLSLVGSQRRIYEKLAGATLNVHVYGVPDWLPPETFPGVIHAGYHGEFRSSWFVVHHAENADVQTAALIAERVGDNEWEALWTFEDERVSAINRYIERDL